jgi:hypothetical protein
VQICFRGAEYEKVADCDPCLKIEYRLSRYGLSATRETHPLQVLPSLKAMHTVNIERQYL